MDYQEERNLILKALAKNEDDIEHLYLAYAELFPQYANFWRELATQEEMHESWISSLSEEIKNPGVRFNRERFNLDVLKTFGEYTLREVMRTKNKAVSMVEAASIAYSLEKSLIEDKFFEVFEGDTPLIKNVFFKLKEATLKHKALVQDLWLQLGGKP